MPQGRLILPPLAERPACTIIIPCLNEEAYIEPVLRAAMTQMYPPSLLEILVCDGGSTDRTRDIVARLAAGDRRVTLVDNPGRFPSAGMNEGIKRARGEVIVRMDAHAEYAPDYVAAAIDALRRTGAATAGGAARSRARTAFQRALCAALTSPLGVGGSAYRDPSREGFVESVWGGAFRREVFEEVGLFDGEARANEDAELNQRIIEAGGTVFLSRDIVAFYYPRSSLRALGAQYFGYGKGRARTLLRRRRLLSPRPLVPCAMVTGMAGLTLLAIAWPAAWPLPAAAMMGYAALVAAEAARVARRTEARLFPRIAAIFPVMHVAHGAGVWAGIGRSIGARLPDPDRIPAR